MKHQKPLIRRTFLQERFIILMELQQKGIANFAELTELDELINRDPKLRNIILEEMEETDTTVNPQHKSITGVNELKQQSLWEKLTSLISGWVHSVKMTSHIANPIFR